MLNNNLLRAQNKIAKIKDLVQKNTYKDSLEAIKLLEEKEDWYFSEKETFKSSLIDFDNSRILFEKERLETIKKAIALFKNIKILKGRNQTLILIGEIVKLINTKTCESSKQAIHLLEKTHTWKTDKGTSFYSQLCDFDTALTRCEEEEKEKERQEKERQEREQEYIRQQQQEFEKEQQEKENAYNTYYVILVVISIITIVLFFTGLWILGIFGIIIIICYAFVGHMNLFNKYDEWSDMRYR
jgi:hypothetical protein